MKGLLLISLCTFLLIGCRESKLQCVDEIGCVELGPEESIKIAVLQPLSGRLQNSGTIQTRGFELALKERGNKIAGHNVEFIFEDSQCSAEGGANAALKAVSDPKVVGILGTNCSGAAAEASKIMSEAGLVMISGTNSAANLTSTDGVPNDAWYPGYFRTNFNSIGRGEAGAVFTFKELKISKVATIHDGDSRSIELVEKFETVFKELGGEIVLSTAIDREDTNMIPVLERVALSEAQLIFYPFFAPETIYLTSQAREVPGLENTELMVCGSTMRSDYFIDEVGEAGKGLFFLGKANLSGEVFSRVKKEYEESYPDLHDTIGYAFAYDAARILFNAIENSVVEGKDGSISIGREKLRNQMYGTRDYNGATGILSSDKFGDCGTPQFNILMLEDPEKGAVELFKNEVFHYIPEK